MSNVVFKGDSVKNFGEYIPVPYVESIVVTNPDDKLVFVFKISVLFLAEDVPNYTNMENILEETNFRYRLGRQEEDKPLSKPEVIGPVGIRSSEIGSLRGFINDFERSDEEYYDSQDRRVIKYTTSQTLNTDGEFPNPFVRDDVNLYLYVFSMIDADLSGPIEKRLLSTSEVAYEKIMSKRQVIQKDERTVYFDQEGTKYSQVPLLGLDRSYYKTQSVTREVVVTSVMRLVNKFKGGSAAGLSDAVTSIEYVLSTESETENLLVELDKVRRSFPNKTNNNPTGNLYAAFATLLQNINSAFLPSEKLIKDKYLAGKVSDLRSFIEPDALGSSQVSPTIPYSRYINMPLVDRKINYKQQDSGRLSTTGIAQNTALYLVDYENLVRERASIFQFFNVDRFFEVCPEDKLSAYKAALFSKFKLNKIRIQVFTHGKNPPTIPEPGPTEPGTDARNYRMMDFQYRIAGDLFSSPALEPINNIYNIETEEQDGGPNTSNIITDPTGGIIDSVSTIKDITILNYNLADSDRQTFAIKYEYNDLMTSYGFNIKDDPSVYVSTGQRHVFDTQWTDFTINMIFDYLNQFTFSRQKLQDYRDQAREECSYNNITNNFNNFFTKSVKKYWEDQFYAYPWELAPTLYSVISYLRTDRFSSLDEARAYANEVMYNISPETGNLEQLEAFYEIMEDFTEQLINPLRSAMGPSSRLEESSPTIQKNYRTNTQMYLSQLIDETAYVSEGTVDITLEDETTEGDE